MSEEKLEKIDYENFEFEFQIPKINADCTKITAKYGESLIFVGANGSGKTRLGAWFELNSLSANSTHRISAQKSLYMPNTCISKNIDLARNLLLYGHNSDTINSMEISRSKMDQKRQNNPAINRQEDFHQLMEYLFSESNYTLRNFYNFSDSIKDKEKYQPKINLVKKIWESVIKHRELVIGSNEVKVTYKDKELETDIQYQASEMSDGERVAFYLIAQCLAPSDHSIIVVDEPELHLHKSIQIKLWNAIEEARPNCLFIYTTHNLEFAVAKRNSQKYCVNSYENARWDIQKVDHDEQIPEELLLQLMGSRQNVVFVEGQSNSLDTQLYRNILKDFLVIPVGGCSRVIESVKAYRLNKQLHHLKIFGIVDRDRRVQSEIVRLKENGIFTLEVAEVENLFLTPDILTIAADHKSMPDLFDTTKDYVIKRFKDKIYQQVIERLASEIKHKVNSIDLGTQTKVDEIKIKFDKKATEIGGEIEAIYHDYEKRFNEILEAQDYDEILKYFNDKTLLKSVSKDVFLYGNLEPHLIELARLIIQQSSNPESSAKISDALAPYFKGFFELVSEEMDK